MFLLNLTPKKQVDLEIRLRRRTAPSSGDTSPTAAECGQVAGVSAVSEGGGLCTMLGSNFMERKTQTGEWTWVESEQMEFSNPP